MPKREYSPCPCSGSISQQDTECREHDGNQIRAQMVMCKPDCLSCKRGRSHRVSRKAKRRPVSLLKYLQDRSKKEIKKFRKVIGSFFGSR